MQTLTNVKTELETLAKEKEKYKSQYTKGVEILGNRVNRTVTVDFRRLIIHAWSSHAKKEKSALSTLFDITKRRIQKSFIAKWRHFCYQQNQMKLMKRKLGRLCHTIESVHLRKGFTRWRVTNYNQVTLDMFKSIKDFEEAKIDRQKEITQLNKLKAEKVIKIMDMKRKAKVFTRWIYIARFESICRKRERILKDHIKTKKLRNTVQKWRARNKATQDMRQKFHKIHDVYCRNLIKKGLEGWRAHNIAQKTLINSICRISKTYNDLSKLYAFTQIQHFGCARASRKLERKKHAAGDIAYLLNSFYKNTLSTTLDKLCFSSKKILYDRSLCKRVLLHSYFKILRTGFDKWKLEYNKVKIIEEINTEGDIAVEAERAKRRVDILKKFLVQNGHPLQDIEQEISRRKEKQNSVMRSFLIRLFFKTSEFNVIPKAFNQLKAWTRTRKMYKNAADMCLKYMRSDIYWAFKRWKHSHEDARKALSHLSKAELIKK